MRKYWEERINSVPDAFTEEEATAMVEWLPLLGDSITDAVGLALGHPSEAAGGQRVPPWFDPTRPHKTRGVWRSSCFTCSRTHPRPSTFAMS